MDDTGFDPARVAGLLRRRLVVIVATLGAFVAIACVAIVMIKPIFSASTLIYVDLGTKDLLNPETSVIGSASENARVDSEVEIVSSDAVLLGVIERLELEEDPQFAPRPGLRDRLTSLFGQGERQLDPAVAQRTVLANFRSAVSVARRGLTYVIAVTVRSDTPGRAAELANAVATTYLEAQLRAKIDALANANAVLEARVVEAASTLLDQYQSFAEGLGTRPGASLLVDRIAQARTLVAEAGSPDRLFGALIEIETTAMAASSTPILDPVSSQPVSSSLAIRGWDQFETLVERAEDLAVQVDLQVPDGRIVSPALPPNAPSAPNWRLILALGVMGGLVTGLALALVQEHFVGGFTSAAQLAGSVKSDVLGDTPYLKTTGTGQSLSPASVITGAPLSRYAEAVRQVRASADQIVRTQAQAGEKGRKGGAVIMVTSARPQEGKTSLALSLARTYALAGVSTVIIDCDLRHPALHRHLGTEPVTGLFDYLSGATAPEALGEIVGRDAETGLSVITGARQSHVPTDHLVTGTAFARLIAAAADNFDMVILDAPPLGPVVDGLYLARRADLAILAVKWASTAQSEVRAAAARLEGALPNHGRLATVLTQNSTMSSPYVRHYQSYYAAG